MINDDHEDPDDYLCKRCHISMCLEDMTYERVDYCSSCAQEVIEEQKTEIQRLQKENKRLKPYEKAIKNKHNGYDPEMRKVMPTLKKPRSPKQALEQLDAENARFEEYYCKIIEKLRNENIYLRKLLKWTCSKFGTIEDNARHNKKYKLCCQEAKKEITS